MSDDIVLKVGSEQISSFLSYTIDADMYKAAGAFKLELDPSAGTQITRGSQCTIEVNGERILTGVVDKVMRGYQKAGRRLTIDGRDILAVAVDSCCESFVTISNRTIQSLAKLLLRGLPYIGQSSVVYAPEARSVQNAENEVQVDAGQTVFDVLRTAAMNRGIMFWARPDGSLVFGRPKATGAARYTLKVKRGHGGPVTEATISEDCSRHYSKIVVVGQQQDDGAGVNISAVVRDSTAPLAKTLVMVHNGDSQTPGQVGRAAREQQRAASRQIEYSVSGHTLSGIPWQVDELVTVWDEDLGIFAETFLIYARTFECTKSRGRYTRLKLGLPGLVA